MYSNMVHYNNLVSHFLSVLAYYKVLYVSWTETNHVYIGLYHSMHLHTYCM